MDYAEATAAAVGDDFGFLWRFTTDADCSPLRVSGSETISVSRGRSIPGWTCWSTCNGRRVSRGLQRLTTHRLQPPGQHIVPLAIWASHRQ